MLCWGWVSSFGIVECLDTTIAPLKSLTDHVTWKLGPLPTCLVLLTSAVSFAGRWSRIRASQVALVVKNPPAKAGDMRDTGLIPGSGRSPGGGMATHSIILAWRIPWTEEPGGLWSIGSQRVGCDWSDFVCTHGLGSDVALWAFSASFELSLRPWSWP